MSRLRAAWLGWPVFLVAFLSRWWWVRQHPNTPPLPTTAPLGRLLWRWLHPRPLVGDSIPTRPSYAELGDVPFRIERTTMGELIVYCHACAPHGRVARAYGAVILPAGLEYIDTTLPVLRSALGDHWLHRHYRTPA